MQNDVGGLAPNLSQPCPQGPPQVLGSSAPAEHKAEIATGTVLKVGFCRHQAQWEREHSFPEWQFNSPPLAEPSALVCLGRPCGGSEVLKKTQGR